MPARLTVIGDSLVSLLAGSGYRKSAAEGPPRQSPVTIGGPGKADQSGNHCGFFRGCLTMGCAFSGACTSGAKPSSLFTHVYECKVFARIVCESARCGANARACSMEAAARVRARERDRERRRERDKRRRLALTRGC